MPGWTCDWHSYDNQESLAVGVHEAGHLAAYLKWGWKVDRISIERIDEIAGYVSGRVPLIDDARTAMMYLAGPVAESRYTGIDYAYLLCHGGQGDFCMAMDALAKHPEPLSPAMLLDQTRQLVDEQWSNIELIANELVRRRHLDYDDVVEIIQRAGA